MKKILVLINDYRIPETALTFAINLAFKNRATLFGIFSHGFSYNENSTLNPRDKNLSGLDHKSESNEDENSKLINANLKFFSSACEKAKVSFKTHTISTKHADALVDNSAFADLIICDADTPPLLYSMNTFLAESHCPVLMINKEYLTTDRLVFAYDDKLSSIYAIRIFTYLFKALENLPVHFVSVIPKNVMGLEYDDLIREWLPLHYPNAKIEIIKGETKDELTDYINKLSNPLIVMGSFSRNSLSRFFKESLANYIMTQTNAPIFIAHN